MNADMTGLRIYPDARALSSPRTALIEKNDSAVIISIASAAILSIGDSAVPGSGRSPSPASLRAIERMKDVVPAALFEEPGRRP